MEVAFQVPANWATVGPVGPSSSPQPRERAPTRIGRDSRRVSRIPNSSFDLEENSDQAGSYGARISKSRPGAIERPKCLARNNFGSVLFGTHATCRPPEQAVVIPPPPGMLPAEAHAHLFADNRQPRKVIDRKST